MSYLCDRYDIYFHDIYLHAPNRLTSSWPKWMGLQMVTTRQENFPFQMRLFCKLIFFVINFAFAHWYFMWQGWLKIQCYFLFSSSTFFFIITLPLFTFTFIIWLVLFLYLMCFFFLFFLSCMIFIFWIPSVI